LRVQQKRGKDCGDKVPGFRRIGSKSVGNFCHDDLDPMPGARKQTGACGAYTR
jgi:hypothetical protein